MCKAGNFDLSFESITSREALALLRETQKTNADTWNKITSSQYRPAEEASDEDTEHDTDNEEPEDDIEVPVDVVMAYMCSGGTVIPEGFVVGSDGALRVDNASEEYNQEVTEGDEAETHKEVEYGRGKRRAVANQQYDGFWRH